MVLACGNRTIADDGVYLRRSARKAPSRDQNVCTPVSTLVGACSHAVYTPKSREAGRVYTQYVIEGGSFLGDVQLCVYSRDGSGRRQ